MPKPSFFTSPIQSLRDTWARSREEARVRRAEKLRGQSFYTPALLIRGNQSCGRYLLLGAHPGVGENLFTISREEWVFPSLEDPSRKMAEMRYRGPFTRDEAHDILTRMEELIPRCYITRLPEYGADKMLLLSEEKYQVPPRSRPASPYRRGEGGMSCPSYRETPWRHLGEAELWDALQGRSPAVVHQPVIPLLT